MPQVQVIKREADPLAQRIADAGTGISEVILRKKAMEMTLMELKAKAAATQSEVDKDYADRVYKLNEYAFKLAETDAPGPMKMKVLEGMGKALGLDLWKGLNEGGMSMNKYLETLRDLPQSPEGSLKDAQTEETQAKTATQHKLNAMLDGSAQEGAVSGGGMTGAGSGAARGMVLSGINGTSPQFKNLGAEQDLIVAQERAKAMVRAEPFMKQYKVMKSQFMDALKELPPISEKPGQAKMDGFINGVKAEYGSKSMPSVQAVNRSLDGLALTVANIANGGGRATSDQDRKAIRETLPDFGMPTATMERLFEYIEAGFPVLNGYAELPDRERSAQLKNFMKQGVETVVEADRVRAKRIRDKFPSATEADINEALRALHQQEGAF